jgi:hypothetical protein
LNGITSVPNLMKIYQMVQKLLVGDTNRQTGDLISLLSFLESRLKIKAFLTYFRVIVYKSKPISNSYDKIMLQIICLFL